MGSTCCNSCCVILCNYENNESIFYNTSWVGDAFFAFCAEDALCMLFMLCSIYAIYMVYIYICLYAVYFVTHIVFYACVVADAL